MKQPIPIRLNTLQESIANSDYNKHKKQSKTKPCAHFMEYTVYAEINMAPTNYDQNKQ